MPEVEERCQDVRMPVVPSALILIAGGSGSGKTTLAHGLLARHPDWTLVHLDDYQKPREQVARLGRWRNWDHPEALDFPALVRDLKALRRGETITVMSRSQTEPVECGAPKTIAPGPVVVFEGYLSLWHPEVRALSDYRIFLDVPVSLRLDRRRWKKPSDYVETVLIPMHEAHLQPTSVHANLHIKAGSTSAESILETVSRCLKTVL